MPNIFPSQTKVTPSFSEPEIIFTYAQPSGAFNVLKDGKPRVKLGQGDLYVYVNQVDLRTDAWYGQSSANNLPSASLVGSYVSTQTYLIKSRAQYDHHDTMAAASYAVNLPQAQNLALRQGIYQQLRTGLLYGFNPANGEGILNTAGATAVTLPPDPYGNTSVTTYDNGSMYLFILNQIVTIKNAMFQTGANTSNKIVILSPQRIGVQLQYANVVQLTSYQRPGAGTATVGGAIDRVAADAGDIVEWVYDDTLIGKGAGGTDAVIITIPEIDTPDISGLMISPFNELQPANNMVNTMYMDMAAPRRIPTPIPDGGITEVQELRATSGWGLRPQGLLIVSMPY